MANLLVDLTCATVTVALFSVAILIPFDSYFIVGDFEPAKYVPEELRPADTDEYTVRDEYFLSETDHCHAWLYLPKNEEAEAASSSQKGPAPPVVLMATGFGAQKDLGPEKYAHRFAQDAGMAVFLFDYRNFGASEGRPRNWVSPKRHLQDWEAALQHLVATNGLQGRVDSKRILLWGTSFAGGHVLTLGATATDPKSSIAPAFSNVVAMVAQVPHLSGKMASKKSMKTRGVLGSIRMIWATLQDKARSAVGLPPVCAKICGTLDDEDASLMVVTKQEFQAYLAKQPDVKLGGWVNQAPLRVLLELRSYNPIETLRKHENIAIPVLIINAEQDDLCPPELVQEVTSLLPKSKYIARDATHFEIYTPQHVKVLIPEMIQFYQSSLAEHGGERVETYQTA